MRSQYYQLQNITNFHIFMFISFVCLKGLRWAGRGGAASFVSSTCDWWIILQSYLGDLKAGADSVLVSGCCAGVISCWLLGKGGVWTLLVRCECVVLCCVLVTCLGRHHLRSTNGLTLTHLQFQECVCCLSAAVWLSNAFRSICLSGFHYVFHLVFDKRRFWISASFFIYAHSCSYSTLCSDLPQTYRHPQYAYVYKDHWLLQLFLCLRPISESLFLNVVLELQAVEIIFIFSQHASQVNQHQNVWKSI